MIKSYTEQPIKDIDKKRKLIQKSIDRYQTAAKESIKYGNIYAVVIFTKAWRDLEKVLEEFDKITK